MNFLRHEKNLENCLWKDIIQTRRTGTSKVGAISKAQDKNPKEGTLWRWQINRKKWHSAEEKFKWGDPVDPSGFVSYVKN